MKSVLVLSTLVHRNYFLLLFSSHWFYLPYYKDNKSDNLELLNVLYNVNMV